MISKTKWLFVSDVDDTLIGDDNALKKFADRLKTIRDKLIIAYNSGRPCASLHKTFSENPLLPIPDFLIGAVGTEIEKGISGEILPEYQVSLVPNWTRNKITSVVDEMGFESHPLEFQTWFKVSYDVFEEKAYRKIVQRLKIAGIAAKVIYSSHKNLDIIPVNAGKGNAIEFLRTKFKIQPYNVIVVGDSGNDIEMFMKPYKGIIVGNATSELKKLSSEHIYKAQLGYANGIIEGLQYWDIF